jgi:hypothetical protein
VIALVVAFRSIVWRLVAAFRLDRLSPWRSFLSVAFLLWWWALVGVLGRR